LTGTPPVDTRKYRRVRTEIPYFEIQADGPHSTDDAMMTLMSQTSITVRTGASVTGRLFGQTSVQLDGNTVVRP
jgi:hypothetical protein